MNRVRQQWLRCALAVVVCLVWLPAWAASFHAPQTLTLLGSGRSLAIGDVDLDGRPDLVYTADDFGDPCGFCGLVYLRQNASGYDSPVVLATGKFGDVALADINADGRVDLLVTAPDTTTVWVYLNNGAGGFSAPSAIALTSVGKLLVADFTGDGKLDLAVLSRDSGDLHLLVGNGLGAFAAPVTTHVSDDGPWVMVSADFNEDGNRDLAIVSSNLILWLGQGDGHFVQGNSYVYYGGLALLDANQDGHWDLLSGYGDVTLLTGLGDGSFTATNLGTNAGSTILAGDFNADSKADFIVFRHGEAGPSQLWLGDGLGGFAPATNVGWSDVSLAFRQDMNGDGLPDAVYLQGDIGILLNALGSTTPDAFAFTPITGATPGDPIESETVTITGIDGSVPISITNGEYSINWGGYVSGASVIAGGDRVAVRVTAAAASITATLTIGGGAANFVVTSTGGVTVGPFSFAAVTAAPGLMVESSSVNLSLSGTATVQVSGGEYRLNSGAYTTLDGTANDGDSLRLRAFAPAAGASSTVTITVGGVPVSWTVTAQAPTVTTSDSTTPFPFRFIDVDQAMPGTWVESNAVSIGGITRATPISVIGGEYAVDGGGFTSAGSVLPPGAAVRVRVKTPSAFGATARVSLNIGGVEATFAATTRAEVVAETPTTTTSVNNLTTPTVGNVVTGTDDLRFVSPSGNQKLPPKPCQIAALDANVAVTFGDIRYLAYQTSRLQMVSSTDGLTPALLSGATEVSAPAGAIWLTLQGCGATGAALRADTDLRAVVARTDVARNDERLRIMLLQGRMTWAGQTYFAGETLEFSAANLSLARLGSINPLAAADGVSLPSVGDAQFPRGSSVILNGRVPRLNGTVARLDSRLDVVLLQTLGNWLNARFDDLPSGDSLADTLLRFKFAQNVTALMPVGWIEINPAITSTEFVWDKSGLLQLSTQGLIARFAAALPSPERFLGEWRNQFDPRASLEITADGVWLLRFSGEVYGLRPDWGSLPPSTVTGCTGLGSHTAWCDGRLIYMDSGLAYKLLPALVDSAATTAAIAEFLPGAGVMVNPDGTVSVQTSGKFYTFAPDYRLLRDASTRRWWLGDDGRLNIRNGDGSVQALQILQDLQRRWSSRQALPEQLGARP